jgi:hypothetical protein
MRHLLPTGQRLYGILALIGILAGYAFIVFRLHPQNFFGLSEDDSIYFSSAKALAEGKGYVLPSVPGTPVATKYPILYPWLLSWIWRWNPSFPANLPAAIAVNVAFGCLFLVVSFLFLRQLRAVNDVTALAVTALCAFHPLMLFYTANLVSDVPFAAVCLAAILFAYKAVENNQRFMPAVLSGVLCGLAVLLRVLGAPVAAGLYLAIALRNGWRKSTIFAVSVAPFFLTMLWRSIVSVPQRPPEAARACEDTWQNTWLYYTNYFAFWKVASIDQHTLWHNVGTNAFTILFQPAGYIIDLHLVGFSTLSIIALTLLSLIVYRGLLREVQIDGWHPVYLALAFYLIPVLIWDYATVDRFLIPFMPLLLAGVAVEIGYVVGKALGSFRESALGRQILAVNFVCLFAAGVVLGASVSWWRGIRSVDHKGQQQAALLEEKREAYRWLSNNTPANAKFIAYEDASGYLYSGRQAIRPVAFLPSGKYRPEVLERELSCLISSADPIQARYWVASDDDFGYEWEPATWQAAERAKQIEASLPRLFRSSHGHVRIYALNSVRVNSSE